MISCSSHPVRVAETSYDSCLGHKHARWLYPSSTCRNCCLLCYVCTYANKTLAARLALCLLRYRRLSYTEAAMKQPRRVDLPLLWHICSDSGCLSRTELEDTAPPRQLMETKRLASALAAYVTRMPPQLPVLFDLLAAFPYKTQVM